MRSIFRFDLRSGCGHELSPYLFLAQFSVAALMLFFPAPSSSDVAYPLGGIQHIWIPRSPAADPLYRFVKDGKAGYINQTGQVMIKPKFTPAAGGEFHDGLLMSDTYRPVFYTTNGKRAFNKELLEGWDFSEGLGLVSDLNTRKFGFIDTTGHWVIAPTFGGFNQTFVFPFNDGLAAIWLKDDVGYLDHSGKFAIPPQFHFGDSFHEDMARVVVEYPCNLFPGRHIIILVSDQGTTPNQDSQAACKFTFIDKSGKVISPARYDDAGKFAEGVAPVKIGKVWGYIDKSGQMVISPRFETAHSFSDGLALVSEGGKSGFIDHTGAYTIKPEFNFAEDFVDGLAVVGGSDAGFWYIDHSGKQAIPEKFSVASSFFKGLAHVKLSPGYIFGEAPKTGKYAYIDRTGNRIFTYEP